MLKFSGLSCLSRGRVMMKMRILISVYHTAKRTLYGKRCSLSFKHHHNRSSPRVNAQDRRRLVNESKDFPAALSKETTRKVCKRTLVQSSITNAIVTRMIDSRSKALAKHALATILGKFTFFIDTRPDMPRSCDTPRRHLHSRIK